MNTATIAAALVAITLTACATPRPPMWEKQGGNQSMLSMDIAACSMLQMPTARPAGGVQAIAHAMNEEALYLNCMASKGWVQR